MNSNDEIGSAADSRENPYAVPNVAAAANSGDRSLPAETAVRIRFTNTMEFQLQAYERYRQQLRPKKQTIPNNLVFALALLIFAFFALMSQRLVASVLLVVLAVYAGLYPLLTKRRMKQAAAVSPFADAEFQVTLTADAFHLKTELLENRVHWRLFSKLISFDDGVLVAQNLQTFHWIPFSAVVSDVPSSQLVALLADCISVHDDRRTTSVV